jgi:outer membrane cobalamin receptor
VAINAAYTHLWTRDLPRRPDNSGSLSLAVTPRRWSFQAGAILVGERQDSEYWLGLNRNPGYQNVYASGSYRLSPHFTPFFRGDNLLNSRYQEVLGYSSLSRGLRGGMRVEW